MMIACPSKPLILMYGSASEYKCQFVGWIQFESIKIVQSEDSGRTSDRPQFPKICHYYSQKVAFIKYPVNNIMFLKAAMDR